MHELIFSSHFDRDKGQDYGRLLLKYIDSLHPRKAKEVAIWTATSSIPTKQGIESFHQRGGTIPPAYRIPAVSTWTVQTKPIYLPVKGVEGNFYRILPFEVTTDKNGHRGDFGIHRDANVEGSLGCIVMASDRFSDFEAKMKDLPEPEIVLTVIYS